MCEDKNLPVLFSLTEEQRKEIQVLVEALWEKCAELEAPLMVAVCVESNDDGHYTAESNYFNGDRVPDCMALARHVVSKNITEPVQFLIGTGE